MLTEPLYLGGVPPLAMPPPELWSLGGRGSGKGGLVGCVRDLVINGLSVQLGEVARYKEKNTLVYTVLCCSKFHIERGRKHENFKAYRQTDTFTFLELLLEPIKILILFFQESRPRVSEARVPETGGPVHCGQPGGSMS